MGWTTTDLLTRIRRDGRLSSNDPDYTDAVLLDIAHGVMLDRIVPVILSAREEYYNRYEDTTFVANQRAYAFSSRAFASTLRAVVYIGTNAADQYELQPVPYSDQYAYAGRTSNKPEVYTVEDDKILPLPIVNVSSGSLRLVYQYEPGVLIAPISAMAITGGVSTGVLTTGSEPGYSTLYTFDLVKGTSPFSLLNSDLTATAVDPGVSVTFNTDDFDGTRLAIGDYVCRAGQSPIPQIPSFLHKTLAQATAATVLMQIGDEKGAGALEQHVGLSLQTAHTRIQPRVTGKAQKWINHSSPLRQKAMSARRYFWRD